MSEEQICLTEYFRRKKVRFPWTIEGLNCFEHFSFECSMAQNVKASKFYRRFKDRYISPAGFEGWEKSIAQFAAAATPLAFDTQLVADTRVGGEIYPKRESYGQYLGAMAHAYFYKPPAFFISHDMAEALANTIVPPMQEPEKVLDSFFLVLPQGFATQMGLTGQHSKMSLVLAHTGTAHYKGYKIIEKLFNVAIERPTAENHPCNKKNAAIHSHIVQANIAQASLDIHYSPGYWDTQMETGGVDNTRWLVNILKNIVLLHNYEKKRFATEQAPRTSSLGRGFRLDSIKAEYPITWIGKNYQQQRTAQDPKGSDQPKRVFKSHWRKGHWHHYWTGVGRKEKILKWVQPVYVKGINLHS